MSSKWFTPRGTGAQSAALDAQQGQTLQQTAWNKDLWNRKANLYDDWLSNYYSAMKPTNATMGGWLGGITGTGSKIGMPDFMQAADKSGTIPNAPTLNFNNLLGATNGNGGNLGNLLDVPKWQDVQSQVQDAYGVLGKRNLADVARQRKESMIADLAKRGLLGRSSISDTNFNALASGNERDAALLNAEGLLAGLKAGTTAREEANKNTTTLADFLSNYNNSLFGNQAQSALLKNQLGAQARNENRSNFWDTLNYLTGQGDALYNRADPQSLMGNSVNIGAQYGNQANQYGQIAAQNAASVNNMLSALAMLYGAGASGGGGLVPSGGNTFRVT